MDNEIIKWYADKGYPYKKVINVGRKRQRLHQFFVKEAMKHCYQRIQDGKKIEDIEIGKYIFNKARDIREEGRIDTLMDEENYIFKIKGMIYPLYFIIFLLTVAFFSYKTWWS